MKNLFVYTAWTALVASVGQQAFADSATRMIWSDKKGFISASASKCTLGERDDVSFRVSEKPAHSRILSRVKEGSAKQPLIENLSDYVIIVRRANSRNFTNTNVRIANSFWQVAMNGNRYKVLNCATNSSPYVMFEVFSPNQAEPVAEIGVNAREINIFDSIRIDKTEEANDEISQMNHEGPTLGQSVQTSSENSSKAPTVTAQANPESTEEPAAESGVEQVICLDDGTLQVRNRQLNDVLFEVKSMDRVELVKGSLKKQSSTIKDVRYSFVRVRFPDRDQDEQEGWIADKYILPKTQCMSRQTQPVAKPEPKPAPAPIAPPTPAPVPAPVVQQPVVKPAPMSIDLLAPNCAEEKILKAAKVSVASHWGNRPNSGGQCALGVRYSLQSSHIGGISQGLGNAVDYVNNLPKYGFVDSGLRDVSKAPAGAVIVFSGPHTESYFRSGHTGRPLGNWVGHVAIKGNDGYFYTDGRTKEPAIGWSRGQNVSHIRNVLAIMVPGRTLIEQYAGKCSTTR